MSKNLKTELKISEEDSLILSYRNHQPLYNHHILIQSIPEVVRNFPNARFIFTRSGINEEYYHQNKKLVKELGVEEHFRFINRWLTDEELRALIQSAHISINIPLQDGLPATLFEIMTTKSIPIVSNLENYHHFFKHKVNGFYLYDVISSDELAETIITALKQREFLSDSFYKNNNEYIRKSQDWKVLSNNLLTFYEFH
jgi:glycosyltransferase involved in cell wall biosynthesis